jgi:hypothetical protein
VRRNPQNPNRKQKIFGFNAVVGTAVELTLGIELPVACITIAGNGQEGNQYIPIKEQILEHHGKTSKIDLADAKYDEHHNYVFSRSHGAIPIIDYNPRNENLTASALKERGYDRNGLAPLENAQFPTLQDIGRTHLCLLRKQIFDFLTGCTLCTVWHPRAAKWLRLHLSKSKLYLPQAVPVSKRGADC